MPKIKAEELKAGQKFYEAEVDAVMEKLKEIRARQYPYLMPEKPMRHRVSNQQSEAYR